MKWNYDANDRMLRNKRLDACFYVDTFYAKKAKSMKSILQSTCFQLFVTDKGYIYVCQLEKESDVRLEINIFTKHIGVSKALVTDGSKAKTSDDVKRFCIKIGTTLKILEQGVLWANLLETCIGILKAIMSKEMSESNSSLRLWDYCVELIHSVHNLMSTNEFKLQGLT